MSALKAAVSQGLYTQGLDVVEDRGGLSVRDLDPELPVSIWVDETERVIRAEAPLCYPIDDYSPDLALAIDHLNRVRAGITYSYREANRALVVSASWTSPNRNPGDTQLHLLMALLLEAKDRDGPAFWRIAEGEGGWDEVVEDTGSHTSQTMRFADDTGVSTGGTGKFTRGSTGQFDRGSVGSATEANRWSEMMQVADTAEEVSNTRKWRTEVAGGMGGEEPPVRTRRASRPTRSPVPMDDVPTRRLDATEDHGAMDEGGLGYDPDQPYAGETPKRLSRHALHAAVSALDNQQHARVDMTQAYGRNRTSGRLLKWLFVLSLFGGIGYALLSYYESIRGVSLLPDLEFFKQKLMSEAELQLKARQELPPGKDLLVAELRDPLPGDAHAMMLQRALDAMGAEAGPTLEGMFARSPDGETRQRAYAIWVEHGYGNAEGAVLSALKLCNENKHTTTDNDPVLLGLLGQLRSSPPPDETLHVAFAWAQDDVWQALVEILGRPSEGPDDDEGAVARSKMLEGQLAKDTAEKLVLQAMVKTGHAPQRAALDLVQANGVKWARGPGQPLIMKLAEADVSYLQPLLGIDDAAIRLYGLDMLVRAGSRQGVDLIVRVMRTDASEDVRLRAVKALSDLGLPEAIWPLALELNRTPKTDTETKVREQALAALKRLPEGEVVREIETHMAPDRELKERAWAITALGHLESPAGVLALIEVGLRDPDERLRRQSIKTLGEQKDVARTSLQKGLSVLRDVGRNDSSEAVRDAANRLYQELIRR